MAIASAKPRRKWLRYAVGALLGVLIMIVVWPSAPAVEIAVAVRAPLSVTVDNEGRTHIRNRYTISTPASGLLRRIDLKPGDVVEAGKTTLASLETGGADMLDERSLAQANARVSAAEASLEMAAANLASRKAADALAQRELFRANELLKTGAISQREFDAAQNAATAAAQSLRAGDFAERVASFELAQTRTWIERSPGGNTSPAFEIRSPISGRVLRVFQESSRQVPGGFPLLEVGDPTDLEIRIDVLSRDAVSIGVGAPVEILRWGGEKSLKGRVRVVEPAAFTKISALGVEEQRVFVVADFVSSPEERRSLGDGFRVEARIAIAHLDSALQVPTGALFQIGETWHAFVLDGRTARLRPVKIGASNGVATEILSGIAENEKVIVYPGEKVRDGVRVHPINAED